MGLFGIASELKTPRTRRWPTGGGAGHSEHLTPRLELDPNVVGERVRALQAALPRTAIRYAVKANPHPAVLEAVAKEGAGFDVASASETRAALATGCPAERLIHSNPVSARAELSESASLGVDLYVVDSGGEIDKLSAVAAGSRVMVRLSTSGAGSDWPLSRKYGCTPAEAMALLTLAHERGLRPTGIAFHVGSQQREPAAWRAPIEAAAMIFDRARQRGMTLDLVDLGGGFPAAHVGTVPTLTAYGAVITDALRGAFGSRRPQTMIEPGRGIVGDAGVLVATVIGVVDRGGRRWVYLDAGVFTGLVETLDEAIRYRVTTSKDGGSTGPCVVAGPTCDSADVLYERIPLDLPLDLAEGDEVRFHSAGAYTTCYSTVGFNGFRPLPAVVVDRGPASAGDVGPVKGAR